MFLRQIGIRLVAAALLMPAAALAGTSVEGVLFKDPNCGCCADYGEYLAENGYVVKVVDTPDLAAVKARHRVPEALAGCHTLVIGGYVVEGHVPLSVLQKLLVEKPPIKGISLPGMPSGSPGMSGDKSGPFTIYEISEGPPRIFAVD